MPVVTEDDVGEAREVVDLAPLPEFMGYLLWRAQAAVFDNLTSHLQEFKLRPIQYSILAVIERNAGLKQSDVSVALGVQPSNFVLMVDELQRRGLIERRRSESDRRAQSLCLTEEGQRLMPQIHALHARHAAAVTEAVGARGREDLVEMLARLRQMSR